VTVCFDVQWNPDIFLREQYTGQVIPMLDQVIVVVSDGKHAMATTCGEYMKQIWPVDSKDLLAVLQTSIDGDAFGRDACECIRGSRSEIVVADHIARSSTIWSAGSYQDAQWSPTYRSSREYSRSCESRRATVVARRCLRDLYTSGNELLSVCDRQANGHCPARTRYILPYMPCWDARRR